VEEAMRTVVFGLTLMTLALGLAATAIGNPAAPAQIPGCAKASLNLLNEGELTLATDNPAFPPWWDGGSKTKDWELNDPSTGKGYESAVAYGIAKRLGFTKAQVTWKAVPFNKSYAPGKKSFDWYIAQVSVSKERAKAVSFSTSYYNVNQAVVGLKSKPISKVRSLAGLKRYKLGAQVGTTSYSYITRYIRPSQSPAVYDSNADAVAALKNGQIDGLVVDFPSTGYITGVQVPAAKVVGRLPTQGPQEVFGLVFQKGNPLVACVNKAIRAMRRDGTLRRLDVRWLGKTGAPILK
jgi:polar amino acid transport system substrate-binding protein